MNTTSKRKQSDRFITWAERHLKVPEGALVGQPIKLHPFQRNVIRGIYDTPTSLAIVSVARKNTKTALSAIIVLEHLVGPMVTKNSQIVSGALSRDQAGLLFKLAKKMVLQTEALADIVRIREAQKTLYCPELGTEYEALSAEAGTKMGLSPVLAVIDEMGQIRGPTWDFYDAIDSAQGAHVNPMQIVISTQAEKDGDLLSLLIDDGLKNADPTIKVYLHAAPEDADPWKEKTWREANPMYGITLNKEYMKRQADKAMRMPSKEPAFRNLHLNQRIDSVAPFVPQKTWKACAGEPDHDLLKRADECYAGLDLSGRLDLTALAYGCRVDGVWHVWCDFFMPAMNLRDRAREDKVPYDQWADAGWITACEGAAVDYEVVARRLLEIWSICTLKKIAFDRWRIEMFIKELRDMEAPQDLIDAMEPFGQGFRSMSPAMDVVEAEMIKKSIRHGGNPVLTMCASNTRVSMDPSGNRKLDKKKSTGRIDGMVAMTMMLGVADLPSEEKKGPSVYNSRGIRTL